MIRYLFDTDTASYFLKGRNPVFQTRCRDALSARNAAISVITEAELLFGLALAPEANRLHMAVKIFLSSTPCFDWTRVAAEHFARVRAQLQRHRAAHRHPRYTDRRPCLRRGSGAGDQQHATSAGLKGWRWKTGIRKINREALNKSIPGSGPGRRFPCSA